MPRLSDQQFDDNIMLLSRRAQSWSIHSSMRRVWRNEGGNRGLITRWPNLALEWGSICPLLVTFDTTAPDTAAHHQGDHAMGDTRSQLLRVQFCLWSFLRLEDIFVMTAKNCTHEKTWYGSASLSSKIPTHHRKGEILFKPGESIGQPHQWHSSQGGKVTRTYASMIYRITPALQQSAGILNKLDWLFLH